MSFRIDVEPSGHSFTVGEGETVLRAALRQGVGLPYGCRSGQCGNCIAHLLSGRVGYPDGQPEALQGQPEDSCVACQAVPASNLLLRVREVERPAEIQPRFMPCRVESKQLLAHDVMRLYLKLPENQRLQFLAGQYLDFILNDGRKRAFSIANAPHDDNLIELHVRHVPGGEFTDYLFNQMPEKTILRIQAPLGSFALDEHSPRSILLMGGGTGFAPLKGMIEHAFYIGLDRPLHLYWGVRSARDLYLRELPEQWLREHDNFRYTPVLSEPDVDWSGRSGFVHQTLIEDYPDLSGYEVYMSGPPVMVEAGRDAFLTHGLAPEHMFSDAFEYAVDVSKIQARER